MSRNIFLTFLLVFTAVSLMSQPIDDIAKMQNDKKYRDAYDKAEAALLDFNYEEALEIYLKWDSVYPNNANLNFKIGYCYANMSSDKPRAIPYLEKAASSVVREYVGDYIESNAPVDLFMLLGIVYHIDYKFNKAVENFDKFIKYAEFDDPELVDSVKVLKEKSYTAIRIINNPLSIKIENLGGNVNTNYPEY
ncbi:MAG TPA: hypothetical protein PLA88_06990, partial [Bacteroidales bacterium]|nr:hypothetical protein [Bacteroidales bacterium]